VIKIMTNEQKIIKELKKWLKKKEEGFEQAEAWNRSRLFCQEVLDKIEELEKKFPRIKD
jgi:hypothetical protein